MTYRFGTVYISLSLSIYILYTSVNNHSLAIKSGPVEALFHCFFKAIPGVISWAESSWSATKVSLVRCEQCSLVACLAHRHVWDQYALDSGEHEGLKLISDWTSDMNMAAALSRARSMCMWWNIGIACNRLFMHRFTFCFHVAYLVWSIILYAGPLIDAESLANQYSGTRNHRCSVIHFKKHSWKFFKHEFLNGPLSLSSFPISYPENLHIYLTWIA